MEIEETHGRNGILFPHYWLSIIIWMDAVLWGNQSKDGKLKSIFQDQEEQTLMDLSSNTLCW